MRSISVEDVRMRYVDIGEGDPLVLLHGFPESHACWRHQIGPLSTTRRVIAPDWHGWGQSERSLAASCEYQEETARLASFLDALGLQSVDLAAHDYGGFLSLGFALAHPNRLRRLAILNSRAHRTFPSPYYQLFGLLSTMGRHRTTAALLSRMPLGTVNRFGLARYARLGSFDRQQLDQYLGWLDTTHGRRWFAHYFADYSVAIRPELAAGLHSITCPVAVIWGDRDRACPFTTAEDLARRIPGATLTRIRGADHYVMEERPDEVTAALAQWLDRAGPTPRDLVKRIDPNTLNAEGQDP